VGVLTAVNVAGNLGRGPAALAVGLPAAAALAATSGLSPSELGVGAAHLRCGARYAAAAGGLVAGAYVVAATSPRTRRAFLDARYDVPPRSAVGLALVVVPLGTVLPEEIAFRGVLWGLLRRDRGAAWATAVSSGLFGLWHVLPAWDLGRHNRAVGAVARDDVRGRALTAASAVAFTAAAGLLLGEVRRRSGSLLAPVGLHWATNGLGVLAATAAWHLSRRAAPEPAPEPPVPSHRRR
jgi:CAAX protease family protein